MTVPLPAVAELARPAFAELAAVDPQSILHSALDLAELFRQGVPELEYQPTPRLGDRAFYRAGAHLLGGHPKEGKSWLLQVLTLDFLESNPGSACVVWDFENGPRRYLRRLAALDFQPSQLERIRYIRSPGLTRENLRRELDLVARIYPGALLNIDSLRGMLSALGAKENDADDIEKALQPLDDVATDKGLLAVVLDHVAKSTDANSRYAARGSGAKLAAVTAAYYVEKVEDFSVQQHGIVKLHVNHDRDGGLGGEFAYEIGGQGDGGALHFKSLDPSSISPEGKARDAVAAFLRGNAGIAFTSSDIVGQVLGGATDAKRKAIIALADDPASPVHKVKGRRANSWRYVHGPESTTREPGI
jgi:hypothetical protein